LPGPVNPNQTPIILDRFHNMARDDENRMDAGAELAGSGPTFLWSMNDGFSSELCGGLTFPDFDCGFEDLPGCSGL
jgi:hypothetical protein